MARNILRWTLGVVGIAVLLVAAALGYRAWCQHENAQALAIHTPNGIEEAEFVRIGGIDQWVQIRGEDRANPVLLIVHGGPGLAMSAFTRIFQPWEKYFTVVQWDQRGAGKTFGRNGETGGMTIARMTQDGLEVAKFLRAHLHKEKIVVVGHSWGTVLALGMVKQRPDFFSAYVGTGQLLSKQQNETAVYAMLVDKVRAANDANALAALRRIGPPPYADIQRLYAERKLLARYDTVGERNLTNALLPEVLFAPNYSLTDVYRYRQGADFAQRATYTEENSFDAHALGLNFAVPMFVFEGSADVMTPSMLSQRYLSQIHAPLKQFVLLPGGGHAAMLTMPQDFLRALVAHVRPIAIQYENGDTHG